MGGGGWGVQKSLSGNIPILECCGLKNVAMGVIELWRVRLLSEHIQLFLEEGLAVELNLMMGPPDTS